MVTKLKEKIIEIVRPERFQLPGYDPKGDEKTTFHVMLVMSILVSLIFIGRFSNAKDRLYYTDYETGKRFLWENAVMPDFEYILSWTLSGFFITAVICLIYIGVRYAYLHKESKSIYLMRRLPRRGEILRRCAAVPAWHALQCIIWAFGLLLVFFAIYMIATPSSCLTPDQWSKIWR